MQEMIGNPQAPGICYRLFSYIINALFARRAKHLEMDRPVSDDKLMEVPNEGSSTQAEQLKFSPSRPDWDTEIVIEFRHSDEDLEYWKNSVLDPKEDGLDQTLLQKGKDRKERGHYETVGTRTHEHTSNQEKTDSEVQPPTNMRHDEKGSRKKVTIKGVAKEKEKSKKKEKIVNQAEETETSLPGRSRPPANGISSINEKSEAFIRSRKEAMRRNYSLDPEKH